MKIYSVTINKLWSLLGGLTLSFTVPVNATANNLQMGCPVWAPVHRPEELRIDSWNTPIGPLTGNLTEMDAANRPTSAAMAFFDVEDEELITGGVINDFFYGYGILTIEGLTLGQTVLVEKFREGFDGALTLQESYRVTDGFEVVAGEVVNFNLVNDITPRDGQIVVHFDFYEPGPGSVVGDYAYRVSSPGDLFAPLDDIDLEVVSAEEDAPQGLFGVVKTPTGVLIEDAIIAKTWALDGDAGFLSGTTSDDDGSYVLPSFERNEFDFLAIKEGFVSRFGSGTSVNLEEDEYLEHDLILEPGTRDISGTLVDDETGNPLAGVELFFFTTDAGGIFDNRKFTIGWTDEAGNFTVKVTEDQWGAVVRVETVAKIGYLTSEIPLARADTTGGNVTGLSVPLKRGKSLIWGSLTDTEGDPVGGVEVIAFNVEGKQGSYGVTDEHGDYRLAVSEGLWVTFPQSISLEDADYSGMIRREIAVTEAFQSVEYDMTARPKIGELYGVFKNEDGSPVGRLDIRALNTNLDVDERVTQSTFETDGEYCIFLSEGEWVLFPTPDVSAERGLIYKNLPTVRAVDGEENDFEVDVTVMTPTATISLTITDENSNPLPGVLVHGWAEIGGSTYDSFGQVDASGVAVLPAISGGIWKLHVSAESTRALGKQEIPGLQVEVMGATASASVQTSDFQSTPPQLRVTEMNSGSEIILAGTGESGRGHIVETSLDLVHWFGLGRVRAVDGKIKVIDQSVSEFSSRFYRAGAE